QLVLADRLPHRLARLRILERVVGRALPDAECLSGDAWAGAVEDPHRDPEALALLAEEILGGNAAAVERELSGRRAGDAHLRLEPRDREARSVGLDDEGGDAGVAGLGIGLGTDGVEVRDARVRDEPLRAVEDVLVALAPRRRPHRRRVGA